MADHDMRKRIQGHMRREVVKLHHHFRIDYSHFQDVLRATGAVLSGLAIVKFILREEYGQAPLDILVYQDRCSVIVEHLSNLGYVRHDNVLPEGHLHSENGIAMVIRFVSNDPDLPNAERVVLVTAVRNTVNLILPLAFAATTISAGYLAASSLHMIFPDLTFKRRALVSTSAVSGHPLIALQPPFDLLPDDVAEAICTLEDQGIVVHWRFNWAEPCGSLCPLVQAHISGHNKAFSMVYEDEVNTNWPYSLTNSNQLLGNFMRMYISGREAPEDN
ncbi:hypothetical protein FRB99_008251 [Tulasnella sp. 403]|nr:hypothetical protein FRB99_008251 [Tulasnella sp. 403]